MCVLCCRYVQAEAGETRVTLDDFPNGRALVHVEIPTAVHARMAKSGLTPEDVFHAMIAAAPKVDVVAVDLPTMGRYFDSKAGGVYSCGLGFRVGCTAVLHASSDLYGLRKRLVW